jgi:hypothetical protein
MNGNQLLVVVVVVAVDVDVVVVVVIVFFVEFFLAKIALIFSLNPFNVFVAFLFVIFAKEVAEEKLSSFWTTD